MSPAGSWDGVALQELMMEQNLVLPALPGGSQSKGSSSLALPGAQTVPLGITHGTAAHLGSNLALLFFCFKGMRISWRVRARWERWSRHLGFFLY